MENGGSGEVFDSVKGHARKERVLDTVTAVLLGAAALLMAWSTWMGSLHEGHEQIHFTESNNTAASAIAMYSDATQMVVQDVSIWSSIQNYVFDAEAAVEEGDELKLEIAQAKVDALEKMCSPELLAAIEWALETGKSPFEMEGYSDSYYEEAKALAKEAQDILAAGRQDNVNSDRFGLATVMYSLVLFLLGIAGTFKRSQSRRMVVGTAVVLMVVAFVFMLSIPMPEGFSLFTYLGVS